MQSVSNQKTAFLTLFVPPRTLSGYLTWTPSLPPSPLRLVTPDSVIQFVHKHMGLVPGWGGAARLVRLVGDRHALRLLGGALRVDPELGLRLGLADGLLEEAPGGGDDGALRQAEAWLSLHTQGPAEVIRAAKRVVVSGRELPLTEALRAEKEVFGTVWGGPANLRALDGKTKHK